MRNYQQTEPSLAMVALVAILLTVVLTAAVSAANVVWPLQSGVLPFAHSDRLVEIDSGYTLDPVFEPVLDRLAASVLTDSGALAELASVEPPEPRSIRGVCSRPLRLAPATANVLSVLGVRPAVGAAFTPDEDREGGIREVIVSHAILQGCFGGSTAPVGTVLSGDDGDYRIIGVLPSTFASPAGIESGEIDGLVVIRNPLSSGASVGIAPAAVARLPAGVSAEELQSEAELLLRAVRAQSATSSRLQIPRVRPLQVVFWGHYRSVMWITLAVAGIAFCCAVANCALLLGTRRVPDGLDEHMPVRGPTNAWRRVLTYLGPPSLIGAAAASVALALSAAAAPSLREVVAPQIRPFVSGLLDARVVVATYAAAFGAAVIAGGCVGAFGVGGPLSTTTSLTRERVSVATTRLVLIVETGLASLCLLAALGSMSSLAVAESHGRQFANVFATEMSQPDGMRNELTQRSQFVRNVVSAVQSSPGVLRASIVTRSPVGLGTAEPGSWEEYKGAAVKFGVSEDAFEVLGIPILAGRAFSRTEVDSGAPVAILSESAVRSTWPATSAAGAVGKVIHVSDGAVRVVGVVGDVTGPTSAAREAVYMPVARVGAGQPMGPAQWVVLIRMPSGLRPDASKIGELLASRSVSSVEPIRSLYDPLAEAFQARRRCMLALVLSVFLSMTVCVTGAYAVGRSYSATLISKRSASEGGNHPRSVLRLVCTESALSAIAGSLIGLAAFVAWIRLGWPLSDDAGGLGFVASVLIATSLVPIAVAASGASCAGRSAGP